MLGRMQACPGSSSSRILPWYSDGQFGNAVGKPREALPETVGKGEEA